MSETDAPKVVELSKPSKLARIKSNAITAGIYLIPAVLVGASMYAGVKVTLVQLETAKLNLEAARLTQNA